MRLLFWIRLSARLARDSRKWWAAVVFGAAVMVVTTTYLVFQSLVVSPQQLLDRDLGRYSAAIGYGTRPVQPGTDWPAAMTRALQSAGFVDAFVSLSVLGVAVSSDQVSVREGAWAENPFPRRFILRQGDWADQPGEVVVAMRDLDRAPRVGERLQLLSGRMELDVVGIATDRFAGDVTTYLVGRGTWAAVPRSTAKRFPMVSAMPMVYWDGSRRRDMVKAFAEAHPDSARLSLDVVRGSLVPAAVLLEQNRGQSADSGNIFAYALPSFGVPLVGAVVWLGLVGRRLLRHRRQLIDLGVRPGAAALVPVGAAIGPLALATVAGVGAGVAVAVGGRPVVASWHEQPLSPLVLPWDPLIKGALVLIVTAVVAFGWLWWRRPGSAHDRERARGWRRPGHRRLAREFRRWLAVLAFVGAMVALPVASSVTVAMGLAATCVVLGAALAPDALAAVIRVLPSRDFRLRMGARQLRSSAPAAAGTAVIAATIGSAIAFTILLSTMIATMDDRQTPEVLPGQVIINSGDGAVHSPAAPEAVRVVESLDVTDRTEAVQLRFAGSDDESQPRVVLKDSDEYVMALDTLEQAKALLGDEWDDRYDNALRSGGLVRWLNAEEGEESTGSAVTLTYEGEPAPLARLNAVNADWPHVDWARGVSALTLSSTMRRHQLPLTDGEMILTGASDSVAAEIRAALRERGLDEDLAVGYREPPPPIPPAGLVATAVLLAATALLMITVSSASRVAELRPTLGVLLANGVPPSWIRQCVLFQEAVVLVVGAGVGAVFGVIPILVSVPRFSGYWTVSLPWGQIAVLLLACVLGSAAAALLSAWRLQPEIQGTRGSPS